MNLWFPGVKDGGGKDRKLGTNVHTALFKMNNQQGSNPLQCSCLENPRDGGAWWAAVYGVAQSQTPLK